MFTSDIKHSNTALADKLEQLYKLRTGDSKIALGFRDPYLQLLEKLGNPHLNLPPTIHVAGTNGKGSTIAMLHAVLEEARYSVHSYTSPHLIKFNERIMLSGLNITDEYLESLIDQALELNSSNDLTFFEITTALAFKAFADNPADILLLETGLGGRLDCTNVIERPLLTIITRIAMDHTEFLGDTLEEIAAEKAGIIKGNVPCVIGTNAQEVTAILNTHSPNPILAPSLGQTSSPLSPNYVKSNGGLMGALSLEGAHQLENAATAITALQTIADKFPITEEQIQRGLANIKWPARLQNITSHFTAPKSTEIWLDGGHNANAAQALSSWANQNDNPLHLICGMMPHKNQTAYIETLKPHCASVQHVAIPNETDLPLSWQDALQNLIQDPTDKNILIGGSLYLAGDVLKSCS